MARKDEEKKAAVSVVKLKNVTRRPLTFNLAHAEYCASGACACAKREQSIETYNRATEEHTRKVVERLICSSVTLQARETVELRPTALNVTEIASALQRGDLSEIK